MKMKMKKMLALLMCTGISGVFAAELSPANQVYISQISQGGPVTLRNAAQSIERSGNADIVVLDTLAEAMLVHSTATGKSFADAVSWSCKGVVASGNRRYYSAVNQVAENAVNRKTRKHCSKAAKSLGSAEGEQYVAGMTSLEAAKEMAAKSAPKVKAASGKSPNTEVQVGMSMEQAYSIAGTPSNTTSYMTGKAFRPFNFKGADNHRTAALYKGQGRIVFSNNNQYSNNMKVLEVIVNPAESGYP